MNVTLLIGYTYHWGKHYSTIKQWMNCEDDLSCLGYKFMILLYMCAM